MMTKLPLLLSAATVGLAVGLTPIAIDDNPLQFKSNSAYAAAGGGGGGGVELPPQPASTARTQQNIMKARRILERCNVGSDETNCWLDFIASSPRRARDGGGIPRMSSWSGTLECAYTI